MNKQIKTLKFHQKNLGVFYENMHNDLLYTNKKQSFKKAIITFEKINEILVELGE